MSLFLVPNEHAAAKFRERYPGSVVKVVGSPRLDTLPAREPGPLTVALSWHWDCRIIAEARSTLWEYRNEVAFLTRRRQPYRLIGHGHPRLFMDRSVMLADWYSHAKIEVVRSFDDVLRQADVFVCDNSSAMYEFASTGRPVVVLNGSRYRRGVHHGLRFWEAASVGVQVDRPRDIGPAILEAIDDAPERQAAREAALDLVYGYRSGAAERAAAAVVEWGSGIILAPA